MLLVNNLSFSYPEKEVLKNITFKAEKGDILAVLGKNAVGKTTLINILTGILEAKTGEIIICNQICNKKFSEEIKSKIGVMRPIVGVFEKMTCYQYLEFVAGLYSVNRSEIFELSKKYQFSEELERQIKKCSAGTRKKIEFCTAIMHEPSILFLDEPFESVDPIIVAEMKEYIRNFAKNDNVVIITSHILDIIQNICNKCIIINNGVVVYADNVTQGINSESAQGLQKIFMDMVANNEKE